VLGERGRVLRSRQIGREKSVVNEYGDRAFRAYWGDVVSFLRRRTGDADRAEELAQQVFADAAADLRDDGRPPLAWLYTVAKRRFADELRSRARATRWVGLPRQVVYDEELRRLLVMAFRELPESQRSVVMLKLVRGLSFAGVADVVGISEEAARMRFSRALKSVRALLVEEGVER
jgi:RNA polymerase sigma-70 factor, ECF subfamily